MTIPAGPHCRADIVLTPEVLDSLLHAAGNPLRQVYDQLRTQSDLEAMGTIGMRTDGEPYLKVILVQPMRKKDE